MLNFRLLGAAFTVMILLSACVPALSTASDPQPLATPADAWTISLMQSGGFAGVMLKVSVSSDGQLTAEDERAGRSVTKTLPRATVARLAGLYSAMLRTTAQSPRSGCADCFVYDLELANGARTIQIHADDTTLAGSGAAELIDLMQQLRDDALRAQP